MSWRILYVESSDTLQLYLDNLKVVKKDLEYLVPISDLHTVILDNYKILLSVHLINALSNANVNVVLCGIDHMPKSLIHPVAGHSLSPLYLREQLDWNDEMKGILQQMIIKNKIGNQIHVLEHIDADKELIKKMYEFERNVGLFDQTNREGLSAKMYFRSMFGERFKRFEDDIVNAGLNYGYAVLRSQISKAIIAKGLNPTLGIFHIGRNNLFNLSDDLIEVFRPLIDVWVRQNLVTETIFTKEHRLEIIKQTLKDVYIKNQKQTLFNAINIFVDNIVNVFKEGIDKYERVKLIL